MVATVKRSARDARTAVPIGPLTRRALAALSARRPPSAAAWSTVRIVALLFHGALRRSELAALCWADVDFSDGDDVVVTVRRSKSDPTGGRADVQRLVGSCAAAVRSLHAAIDLQINRRFAAACAAAGLEGRRTSHGGRVDLAVELTARGASTHAIQQ